jgi:hypothetical protein
MSTSAIGSSKSLNGKTIGITATAAVIVLAIIGWTAGWFGGSEPAPAPAATTTEQPAAQGTAPAAPAAGQQYGGTTSTTP